MRKETSLGNGEGMFSFYTVAMDDDRKCGVAYSMGDRRKCEIWLLVLKLLSRVRNVVGTWETLVGLEEETRLQTSQRLSHPRVAELGE